MGCVRFGIKMANPVHIKRFIKRLNLFAIK